MGPGQDGKGLPVALLGLLDKVAIQPIVPSAASIGDAYRLY